MNLLKQGFAFKVNRTVVMGVVAALLTALTLFDYIVGGSSSSLPHGSTSSGAPSPLNAAAGVATVTALGESAPVPGKARAAPPSASQAWQEIRALSRLQDNAPAVVKRYQVLALPYAEIMAEVAVLQGADETPEEAAKRGIAALLPATVQIRALLVAEVPLSPEGNTRLSVNLSLESADSQAMQQAVLTLGNPAAGLVWRELALSADSEKRLITLSGVLSVLAFRYAE